MTSFGEYLRAPPTFCAGPRLAGSWLRHRHERLARLRSTILDRARTMFVLVTIPERLAVEETAGTADVLADTGVGIGGLVVNRVLPELLDGDFYRARKAQEQVYLGEIERRFTHLPRIMVRQLPRDVYGLASLALISEQLV